MATTQQNRDFAGQLFPTDPLDSAIEWIKGNLSPGDVFDDDAIAEHARNNIEIDDVYSERNILDYVQGSYSPGAVFTTHELESWAEDNGYAKE